MGSPEQAFGNYCRIDMKGIVSARELHHSQKFSSPTYIKMLVLTTLCNKYSQHATRVYGPCQMLDYICAAGKDELLGKHFLFVKKFPL